MIPAPRWSSRRHRRRRTGSRIGRAAETSPSGADAGIGNTQVFFVLPPIVAEAKLEPILIGRCSTQHSVEHEVLDAPPAEEVVVVRIGGKRSCARRESGGECGQETEIWTRIKEVACPGRLDPHVFHPAAAL